jgi:hypothetical protein
VAQLQQRCMTRCVCVGGGGRQWCSTFVTCATAHPGWPLACALPGSHPAGKVLASLSSPQTLLLGKDFVATLHPWEHMHSAPNTSTH